MKPHVICHMLGSLDGRLHPSRFTASPDGDVKAWSGAYEAVHESLDGDAWLVGRTTMAEMSRVPPHPPETFAPVRRPHAFSPGAAPVFAIALDPSGRLHFAGGTLNGDHVVVLLGREVADSHLAELAADGVSYLVAAGETIDLAATLDVLGRELGIRRLLLEGGGTVNGSFFAAGLVDELSVLVAPALDARRDADAIVMSGADGLAGKARLSLLSASPLEHGLVHLRYAVTR